MNCAKPVSREASHVGQVDPGPTLSPEASPSKFSSQMGLEGEILRS